MAAHNISAYSPTVSIVISTLNRADMLEKSLKSLEQQNYSNFEVVVVNGPSTDRTNEILEKYSGKLIAAHFSEINISKSRNIGIARSSGELILFLDDDAFAEPDWISNIVDAYRDPRIGGVGTRVYDHTGFKWQMNPFLVDKFYRADFKSTPPLWAFEFASATTIPHILGASSSFRRECLAKIAGFDEEIEYFLDESEVCRRIAETGRIIRFLDEGASVHHQFAPGVTRDDRRVLTHPYPVVKNIYYVCLSDWRRNGGSLAEYLEICGKRVQELTDGARWQVEHGGISRIEYENFMRDVERGARDGRARALEQERKSITVPPANPAALVKFPTKTPAAGRRCICFISRWIPRRSPGGIARYMWDLATGFAARGYETHLITLTDGPSAVEFHDGLWIRHISQDALAKEGLQDDIAATIPLRSAAAKTNIAWAKAAHEEVLRLRQDRYIDLVVAPVWDQEGLYCALDHRLNTIISMNTTFRRFADIEFRTLDLHVVEELRILEDLYVGAARFFHANSSSSTEHLRKDFRISGDVPIVQVPHGIADITPMPAKTGTRLPFGGADTVRILYLSRLEQRKGTDLFLEAAAQLVRSNPHVVVDIVGHDSYADQPSRSFKTKFQTLHPDLAERVIFHGELPNDEVDALCRNAAIFCVPSRYESFGIIFIEAMRYQLPVIALDVGGARDIVENNVTGILCPANQGRALLDALQKLSNDKALRTKMGKAGRQRFLRLFENEIVTDRTAEAFCGLLPSFPSADH